MFIRVLRQRLKISFIRNDNLICKIAHASQPERYIDLYQLKCFKTAYIYFRFEIFVKITYWTARLLLDFVLPFRASYKMFTLLNSIYCILHKLATNSVDDYTYDHPCPNHRLHISTIFHVERPSATFNYR